MPLSIDTSFSKILSHEHSTLQQQQKNQPRYKSWKGKNTFFCGGIFMTGANFGQLYITFCLILLTWTFFGIIIAPFYHSKYNYIVPIILYGFCVVTLFVTGFTEPGILPRREHYQYCIIKIESARLKENYCSICSISRSFRARHFGTLQLFHIILISKGQTTNEFLRNRKLRKVTTNKISNISGLNIGKKYNLLDEKNDIINSKASAKFDVMEHGHSVLHSDNESDIIPTRNEKEFLKNNFYQELNRNDHMNEEKHIDNNKINMSFESPSNENKNDLSKEFVNIILASSHNLENDCEIDNKYAMKNQLCKFDNICLFPFKSTKFYFALNLCTDSDNAYKNSKCMSLFMIPSTKLLPMWMNDSDEDKQQQLQLRFELIDRIKETYISDE
eukprot:gene9375-12631_t